MTIVDARPLEGREMLDTPQAGFLAWRGKPIPVLAATDGRPQSDLALLVARRLVPTETLGVVSVIARATDDVAGEARANLVDSVVRQSRVEWQVRRVLGADAEAQVEVRAGDPPTMLAAVARQRGAHLVVVGIGRPKVSDRLLGDESTLNVIRAARTPVLAVATGCALPAQRVVVAVDFSPTSYAAAALATRLAGPRAVVTLVHVAARAGKIAWGSESCGFRGDVDLALANWCARLRVGFAGTLSPTVLHGDAATEIAAFATGRGADLVAVGAHGHGPMTRAEIGAIAARLIRCASWSLLVTPRVGDARTSECDRTVPGSS
jgi:nucleotide-binding universal stress UspA family protein